jgi:hypothetical protein
MRRGAAALTTALLAAGAMLACGSSPVPSSSRGYRGKVAPGPAAHDPTAELDAYVVPPSRSLHAVVLDVLAPDPEGAADQVRADHEAMRAALSDLSWCSLQVVDYQPSWGAYDQWHASMQLTLAVDLTEAATATERMDRIDACRGPVLSRISPEQTEVSGTDRHHSSRLEAGRLVVDDLPSHLPALLARLEERRATVHSAAPSLSHDDLRCTSQGVVSVQHIALSGAVLTVDSSCRVIDPVPEVPAAG